MRSNTGELLQRYPSSDENLLKAAWETLYEGESCKIEAGALSVSAAELKSAFLALSPDRITTVFELHFQTSQDAMHYMTNELEEWEFCVTKTSYIGLVPDDTRKGDVIMLVYRAQVLFVLRLTANSA